MIPLNSSGAVTKEKRAWYNCLTTVSFIKTIRTIMIPITKLSVKKTHFIVVGTSGYVLWTFCRKRLFSVLQW